MGMDTESSIITATRENRILLYLPAERVTIYIIHALYLEED